MKALPAPHDNFLFPLAENEKVVSITTGRQQSTAIQIRKETRAPEDDVIDAEYHVPNEKKVDEYSRKMDAMPPVVRALHRQLQDFQCGDLFSAQQALFNDCDLETASIYTSIALKKLARLANDIHEACVTKSKTKSTPKRGR